jgi:hypothetical protein
MRHNTRESRNTKWQALIEKYEKSGLSQKAFCEQNNLILSRFVYHRGKIKSAEENTNPSSNLFSPIQLQRNASNDPREMKIIFPNGFQCIFPYDADANAMRKWMEVLLSC